MGSEMCIRDSYYHIVTLLTKPAEPKPGDDMKKEPDHEKK